MSFDDSFSVDSAVDRLLSRHPILRSDPKLLSLSLKGKAVTEEEAVSAVSDAFLHPSYTVAVIGCFRPLARRIVERVLARMKIAGSLETENEEASAEEIGEEEVGVVDFYVGRGRGLRLNEVVSLALCRALDLMPFLLRYSNGASNR